MGNLAEKPWSRAGVPARLGGGRDERDVRGGLDQLEAAGAARGEPDRLARGLHRELPAAVVDVVDREDILREKLTRNVDYFIDYEAGFITFFNPDRIGPSSTIDMSFEVAPFANLNNDTLLGTRVSQEWGAGKYSVGTTMLYQAGSKLPTVPQITELSKSLLVYEFDTQIKRVKIGDRLIMTLAGEFAQSRQNLNLNQFALIDNMEGIKQEELAPTLAAQWQIASNPSAVPASPSQLSWTSEDVNVLTINPNAQASASESQKVLNFTYGVVAPLTNAGTGDEVSIVYPFSISGVDMSQKTILEVVMLGDSSNNEINFRLGGIDENADGSSILRTEDTNGDGILQAGEASVQVVEHLGGVAAGIVDRRVGRVVHAVDRRDRQGFAVGRSA